MFSKTLKLIFKHKFITGIGLILIIIGGYFGYQSLTKDNNATRYITAAVEKGTLIVSISGSGQIDVSDRTEIKPEVSGKITGLYITKGQKVSKGSLLASIDSRDAQSAVIDAEISLESAKIKLDELLAGVDSQSLLQAENALAQAGRDLEKAEEDYENIEADAERTLAAAYEDGYSNVSTSFFKLSDYMEDLQDVLGMEQYEPKHVSSYKIILGENSLFIQKLLNDYYRARDLYNKNFTFFREVYRDDDRDTVYQLISDTLETTKAIAQALESARHMYDAIVARSYTQYYISFIIDKMQPKVESDLPSVFSSITSFERTIESIDGIVQETPDKIKDSELVLESAKEKLESKKLALEEIKAGADTFDIKAQQNTVAQREAALLDAKEKLADHLIYAPFDGVIGEVNVKAGDSISPGTVFVVLMTEQQIAELTLNEMDIAKVKLNQPVTLTFDAVDELTLTGKVTDIASNASINQGVVTYGITITLDTMNELIKPGMTVNAAIVAEVRQDVLLMSNSAIKQQGGISYVQVADKASIESDLAAANISGVVVPVSGLRTQQVQVGLSNDTMTEILEGLKQGDIVVTQTINSGVTASQSQQNIGGGGQMQGGIMRMMR